jgi:hypothetical protein
MPKAKTEDQKALVAIEKFDIVSASEELKDALEANLSGEVIDASLLDRVKCPSGGATIWTIPDAMGEEINTKELVGVIIHSRMSRAFWRDPFSGGGTPPDCFSDDMVYGQGDPGGECDKCPMNEFGSDPNKETQAKACSESRLLFVLLPDEDNGGLQLMPTVLKVPPASLRNSKKFLLHLSTRAKAKMWQVVTAFTLTKEKNAKGMDYAQIHFAAKKRLPPEIAAGIAQYRTQLMPILDKAAESMMREASVGDEAEGPSPV